MRNHLPLAALVAVVAAGAFGCGGGGGGSPSGAGGSKISGGAAGGLTTGGITTAGRTSGGATSSGVTTGGGASTSGGATTAGATASGATTAGATSGGGSSSAGTGLYYSENFDGPNPKIVLQAGTLVAQWWVGPPANLAAGAHSGANCLAVTMTSTYMPGLRATCMTTPIDLSHATKPVLVFFHAYDAETNFDGGRVQITSPTIAYQTIEPFRAYSKPAIYMLGDAGFCGQSLTGAATTPQWVEDRFDLSDPAFRTAGVQIVFDFTADPGSVGGTGWFVDDVQVGEPAVVGPLTPFQRVAFQESFDGASPQFRTIPATGSNWSIGTPLGTVGPKAAASPPRCAGTNMAAPASAGKGRYPDGVGLAYPSSQPDRLVTTAPVTVSGPDAALVFQQFFDFEGLNASGQYPLGPNYYDGGRVIATKDPATNVWIVLEPRDRYTAQVVGFMSNAENAAQDAWCGLTTGYRRAFVDLAPAIQQLGQSFYIGFEFASDSSNYRAYAGWYIDDVQVIEP